MTGRSLINRGRARRLVTAACGVNLEPDSPPPTYQPHDTCHLPLSFTAEQGRSWVLQSHVSVFPCLVGADMTQFGASGYVTHTPHPTQRGHSGNHFVFASSSRCPSDPAPLAREQQSSGLSQLATVAGYKPQNSGTTVVRTRPPGGLWRRRQQSAGVVRGTAPVQYM